ncbi:MAG: hypothetical protein WBB29_05620 [Geitlerinemataceae cyanobacterium]
MFPPSFLSSAVLAEAGEMSQSIDLGRWDKRDLKIEAITVKAKNIQNIRLAVNASIDGSQSSENCLDFVSRKLRGLLWGVTRGIQRHPLKSWLAEWEMHHLTRNEEVVIEVEPNTIA